MTTRPAIFRIWNEKTPSKKTRPLSTDRAIAVAQERMRRNGGPVQFWNFREGRWSRRIAISKADGALRTRLRENKVGQAERVKCRNGVIFRVHRIEVAIPRPHDWDKLTPLARGFYVLCATIDPEGDYGGGYVCRRSNHNRSIWSTHAYSEAIDWFRSSMAKGDEIKREAKKKWGDRVTPVWRTTAHWDHIHLEENPSRVHALCRFG
jgi:hypothetical protein